MRRRELRRISRSVWLGDAAADRKYAQLDDSDVLTIGGGGLTIGTDAGRDLAHLQQAAALVEYLSMDVGPSLSSPGAGTPAVPPK